ncbi:MAG: ABC transporter permease [Caldilineaceae bacterium]|nr:ABC transporter permease [Caldilineaceae bacterium]MCY4091311.1 ABC transporter permease [Caldilineaceae bacterium]MCY4116584.1 ABC transporter permease [Caldilineaceae bacterium]MDE0071082.1 ABC transporter permease [Caldilineaceae bacterium]MDE0181521.1 ABC transporter permease [Caldilineaceae bacterium]
MAADQSSTQQIQAGDLQQGLEEDDAGAYLPIEEEEEQIYVATPLQMMWWRFIKHRMAIVGGVVVIILYVIALFAEFLAPYNPETYEVALTYAPPQRIHLFHDGEFQGRPFVYGLTQARNPETLRMEFQIDERIRYPVRFWVEGDAYKLWGLFKTNLHLFGVRAEEPVLDNTGGEELELPEFAPVFILGADKLGRDMFTRIIYGSRISLSIGLIGVTLSFIFGVVLGGISGYYGGVIDVLIQRVIEFIRSVPSIPLWMALSAALPQDWSSIRVYFGITIILSLIGWTFLARAVRGRFLSMREEEFVLAARFAGASEMRIILRHMVPSFFSHLIASATLAVPTMILSETSLSFLGLGLRPPTISWGVLLQEAQNLRSVALAPWLLLPGLFVIVTVLALSFLGDGLRDAADPYH